jgi:hypothetical protein
MKRPIKDDNMTLKGKINSVIHHPSILKDGIEGKSSEEIRAKVISQRAKGLGRVA